METLCEKSLPLPDVIVSIDISYCPSDIYIGRKVYFYTKDHQGNISKLILEINSIHEDYIEIIMPQVREFKHFWCEDDADQFIEYVQNQILKH